MYGPIGTALTSSMKSRWHFFRVIVPGTAQDQDSMCQRCAAAAYKIVPVRNGNLHTCRTSCRMEVMAANGKSGAQQKTEPYSMGIQLASGMLKEACHAANCKHDVHKEMVQSKSATMRQGCRQRC